MSKTRKALLLKMQQRFSRKNDIYTLKTIKRYIIIISSETAESFY